MGEGEGRKSTFDKGGNNVWPKYSKGEKELRICLGRNTFNKSDDLNRFQMK